MLDALRNLLSPLIWIMTWVLEVFHSFTHSYGLSIVLLSLFMAIISYPIVRFGLRSEERYKKNVNLMVPKLNEIKANYKGEKQFRKIEKLYEEHNYHPIKSIFSASGFLVQLPFLLASMLLFIDYPPMSGIGFTVITDLMKPDGLLPLSINLLPFIMSGIAIFDAFQKPNLLNADRNKFIFISVVLCVLVYPLSAAVIFYWICNNIWSLLLTLKAKPNSLA